MLVRGIIFILLGVALLFWRFPTLRGKRVKKYRTDRRLGNFVTLLLVAIFLFVGARLLYFVSLG